MVDEKEEHLVEGGAFGREHASTLGLSDKRVNNASHVI